MEDEKVSKFEKKLNAHVAKRSSLMVSIQKTKKKAKRATKLLSMTENVKKLEKIKGASTKKGQEQKSFTELVDILKEMDKTIKSQTAQINKLQNDGQTLINDLTNIKEDLLKKLFEMYNRCAKGSGQNRLLIYSEEAIAPEDDNLFT